MRLRGCVVASACVAALGGCVGEIWAPPAANQESKSGGSGSIGGTGSASSSGSGASSLNWTVFDAVGPMGMLRLTVDEYDITLRDIVKDTSRPAFRMLPADPLVP